jgi:Flp pilus assembly protein TadG
MHSAENRASVPQTNDGRYVDVLAKRWGALRQVLRCRRGASTLEFALIAIPLLALMIGIPEISWQLTTAAALDEAVLRASRFGITGQATQTGEPPLYTCRSQTIAWIITSSTGGFLKPAQLTVSIGSYGSASGLSGGIPAAGAGTGGQIVTYTVTYAQPFLTDAWVKLIGGSASLTHQATVVVKNEPFDNATC